MRMQGRCVSVATDAWANGTGMSEKRKINIAGAIKIRANWINRLCEDCDQWYFTGHKWHDELFCRNCYLAKYPKPDWLEE